MCPFKIGDKVVCVGYHDPRIEPKNNPGRWIFLGDMPIIGKTYVVEAIACYNLRNGTYGIALVGSTVLLAENRQEVGWCHKCFRKLEEIQAENRAKNEQKVTQPA